MMDHDDMESMAKDRDGELFNLIADVLDFKPELYNQESWGHFVPDAAAHVAWLQMYEGVEPADDGEDARWAKVKECGTAMCVAGHAASLSGWHPILTTNTITNESSYTWNIVNMFPDQGHGSEIRQVAQQLLGVTDEEAEALFDGNATWDGKDLRAFGRGDRILADEDCV
jgi:hypothetical protein